MYFPLCFFLFFGVFASENRIKRTSNVTIDKHPSTILATLVSDNASIPEIQMRSIIGTLISPEYFLTSRFPMNLYAKSLVLNFTGLAAKDRWRILTGDEDSKPINSSEVSKCVVNVNFDTGDLLKDKDELGIGQIKPPLSLSAKVKAATLPSSLNFTCDKVMIVDWENRANMTMDENFDMKTLYPISLKEMRAKVVQCEKFFRFRSGPDKALLSTNHFCVKLDDDKEQICRNDAGLPVFCNGDILVGILQDPVGVAVVDCAQMGYATNISHYMGWLSEKAGVKAPFTVQPGDNGGNGGATRSADNNGDGDDDDIYEDDGSTAAHMRLRGIPAHVSNTWLLFGTVLVQLVLVIALNKGHF